MIDPVRYLVRISGWGFICVLVSVEFIHLCPQFTGNWFNRVSATFLRNFREEKSPLFCSNKRSNTEVIRFFSHMCFRFPFVYVHKQLLAIWDTVSDCYVTIFPPKLSKLCCPCPNLWNVITFRISLYLQKSTKLMRQNIKNIVFIWFSIE